MNPPIRVILFSILGIFAVFAGAERLWADEPRWNVTAECQMVTLPQKAALALIPELQDEAKIEAAYAKLQAMIERKEATLVAQLTTKAKDGEKSVVESVEEMRYATEYDPPQVPDSIPEDKPNLLKEWPVVGITPKGFETRNTGVTLEVENKVLADGRVLSVDVGAYHMRFVRWVRFEAGRLPNGEHLSVEQPQFATARDTVSMLVRNGQRVLLGIHMVPNEPETMELHLLKVSATAAP